MRRSRRQKGSVVVEFSLAGIASLLMIIMTMHLSLAMWHYHSLANAVRMGALLAAVKGKGCTTHGNTCGTTVGAIANRVAREGVGVSPSRVNLSLVTSSGEATACNPLSSCFNNSTPWPPSSNSDNLPGRTVTLAAQYNFPFPLVMFWPGAGNMDKVGAFALPASSTQRIVF